MAGCQGGEASGVSVSTIWRGLREIKNAGRRMDLRNAAGPVEGKSHAQTEPRLAADLDPLWTGNAGRSGVAAALDMQEPSRVGKQLQAMGHDISYPTVGTLLRQAGYSLQANQKAREGSSTRIATPVRVHLRRDTSATVGRAAG